MTGGTGSRAAAIAAMLLGARPLWWALGGLNLIAGVVIALRPAQSQDLQALLRWCRLWLADGAAPYFAPWYANYPPYALVMLSPLTPIPAAAAPTLVAALNVAFAMIAGWLGLRLLRDTTGPAVSLAASAGLFLAWQSVRIVFGNGQLSLLVMACGLGSIWLSERRTLTCDVWSGVLLALALIKPQMSIAFVLWLALGKRLTPLAVAAGTVAAAVTTYAVRLGESPLQSASVYAGVLRREMTGSTVRIGDLELRGLFRAMLPTAPADALHATLVVASLGAIVFLAVRMQARERLLFLLPLTLLWSLMSVYHLVYDSVMLWPVWIAIAAWPRLGDTETLRVTILAVLQAVLVVDVGGLAWKLNGRTPLPAVTLPQALLVHFDRLLIVALFALVLIAAHRSVPRNAMFPKAA